MYPGFYAVFAAYHCCIGLAFAAWRLCGHLLGSHGFEAKENSGEISGRK
jgi:hypothetical protein